MAKSVPSLRSPLQVVGQPVTRTDARVKVTGEAQFSADRMPAGGLLFGKTLRSPHPHAEIVHIDAARADGLPGVRAVVTFRDVPENPFEDGDVVAPDGPLAQVYLLNRIVRHVGDEVAQFQLDVYGEVMDALHLARLTGKEPDENAWRV
jgi:CO/xanthine dehydrogenase Mo-binding subunit